MRRSSRRSDKFTQGDSLVSVGTLISNRPPTGSRFSSITMVLNGPPRTKKNSSRVFGGIPLPSEAFIEWNALVQPQLAIERSKAKCRLPITTPVNARALFYRKTLVGDACNFYQALADALQEGRIVEDDRLIVSWDGSRLLKDSENPRVIVTLEEVAN